jgi:two-component system NtrC family sensor kinase
VEFSSNTKIEAAAACGESPLPGSTEPSRSGRSPVEGAGRACLLARLLDSSTRPFVGLDLLGSIVSLNGAFSTLAGTSASEAVGKMLTEVTCPRDRGTLEQTLERARASGGPAVIECTFERASGKGVRVEIALEPDRDEDGELAGFFAFCKDLSERERIEHALRESEERFRRLYDEAPIGYHEVDSDGRILNVNRTECELLGYSRAELIGRSVFDLVAQEYRDSARQSFPAKIAGKRPLTPFERTVERRDGRRLIVMIEERYKRDDEDRVVGIFSVMRDVTDHKLAEAALVNSERRNRALFEGMEEAVFVHAPDGRILEANPAASRLLGYSHEEFLAMTTADIDDPGFAAGFEERLNRQLAQGHLSFEGRHRTKQGRVIPVEITTSTIYLDDQKAVLAVIRDISERVALEETRQAFAEAQSRSARELAAKNAELTLSEARYRQLTEGCLDGVVVADCAGTLTLFNPAAERMFGYESGDVVGRHIGLLMPKAFPGDQPVRADRDVPSQPHGLVGKTVEIVGRRKGGEEFPIELSLSAIERSGEFQLIGSIRDQTERQRMRAMLAQSEKLASIGLLSADVAHEINNPISYVANNLAVLERDLESLLRMVGLYESIHPVIASAEPETLNRIEALAEEFDWPYVHENLPRMLSRTREGIQRVAAIVTNLRGRARTSSPKMETVSISDLLESALEMLRGRLRRNHIEVVIEHGDVPAVVCVPAQISQVLLNLLINAAQAVETAGRPEGGWIRFASASVEEMAALCISDNGCGIEPEHFPRLFDPFFTTKSIGEGTGLGLSICQGIVTGHGGRIEVDSILGEGTTFRVLLPVKPE